MKHAVAWWCLERAGMTLPQVLDACRTLGYDGIELPEAADWPAIREAGLTIASIRGHETLTDGLNRRENHDRIEREIRANLERAVEWGIPALICFSGNRDGISDEAGIEETALGLSRVAKAAEEAGVTLALELLNSRVDHPGYQCDRTAWGLAVIERVASPAVKLLYDVYHMQVMEGNIIGAIRAHHPAFAHYHVAGNPGRHEPDSSQELRYPAIYEAIAATGFTGYVGMEFIPRGDPIASLRAALNDLTEGDGVTG